MEATSENFIEDIIKEDLDTGVHSSVLTRFPPEPNGYLHIGHVKAISANFGMAAKFGGETILRFDDTNPSTETKEFAEAIRNDINWLGYRWIRVTHASHYFHIFHQYAKALIRKGLAYVDDSTSEEIALGKGTPTKAGINSEYRSRSIDENTELFDDMCKGVYEDGSKVLRAKIDMSHTNMLMRDPIIYRIKHEAHHQSGTMWCIYPMYDFAHCISDSMEKITHSLCTLEFAPHRELYDWFLEKLEIFPSKQYEFSRLNISNTVMSKRKLLSLIEEEANIKGWDDPALPTISGMRRRGYPAEAIRNFIEKLGITKRENEIEQSLLDFCVRETLNKKATRRMVVVDPLKLTITNYPEEESEVLPCDNNPEDPTAGSRELPFCKHLVVEQSDFMEDAPRKFNRLSVGRYVRLKAAYIVKCNEVVKDADGKVIELLCEYFPESKSGEDTSGIKAKGVIHWVDCYNSIRIDIREYGPLLNSIDGGAAHEYNEDSYKLIQHSLAERDMSHASEHDYFQFMRVGYFKLDPDSNDRLIFNKTVSLKEGWKPKVK